MSAVRRTPDYLEDLEPAWEIATLFPPQGQWSDSEYLSVANEHNRHIEMTDGRLEILPLPKPYHQRLLLFLSDHFRAYMREHKLGEMLTAPMPVRMRDRKWREPDLVYLSREHFDQSKESFWDRADLAVEIVSDDSRKRDMDEKRGDYAEAGIAEYWIVDPREERIEVLTLRGKQYAQHGLFGRGEHATSSLLTGFRVDVSATFDAGNPPA